VSAWRRRPLYGADNEDTRSELAALEIAPGDTAVAIAAGGGRALSLLVAGPARLVALDRAVDQLHQLELKAAAVDALEREALLGFLGLAPDAGRRERYAALRGALSPGARRYWDQRGALVGAGVQTAGRLERALLRATGALRALGLLGWATPLFAAQTLEAQRALLASERRRAGLALASLRLLLHPLAVFAATQDPGFLRSSEGPLADYLVRRFLRFADAHLVRESFLLRMLHDGAPSALGPLPPWLDAFGLERVKKNLERLELCQGDLRDFAARTRGSAPHKWSLSDVSCWMPEAAFHALLDALARRSPPGSRLVARHFAVRPRWPDDLPARLCRLPALSARLDADDTSIVYRFDVAEVDADEAYGTRISNVVPPPDGSAVRMSTRWVSAVSQSPSCVA
jgi:S-adenosylmethionine-diacylglycerol 3-amino-3-carboxypropyl transferase